MLRKLMSSEILRIRESNCTLNTPFCHFLPDTKDTKTVYNWAPDVAQEKGLAYPFFMVLAACTFEVNYYISNEFAACC